MFQNSLKAKVSLLFLLLLGFSLNSIAQNQLPDLDLSDSRNSQNIGQEASPEQTRALAAKLFSNKKYKGREINSLDNRELMEFFGEELQKNKETVNQREKLLNSILNQ